MALSCALAEDSCAFFGERRSVPGSSSARGWPLLVVFGIVPLLLRSAAQASSDLEGDLSRTHPKRLPEATGVNPLSWPGVAGGSLGNRVPDNLARPCSTRRPYWMTGG